MNLRGLYAITPDSADSGSLIERVRGLLDSGAGPVLCALQYRNKRASREQRTHEAAALAAMCRTSNVVFIVNDDPALAVEVDADGVHLGSSDGDIAQARLRLDGRLLGVSCYDRLDAAHAAVAAGADYVAFGSVYPSPTKPAAVQAPLELFRQARGLGVPLVAIGGITLSNAAALVNAGADALAVISDIFDAPDIASRALGYAAVFNTFATERP